jgi:hypothetical protein
MFEAVRVDPENHERNADNCRQDSTYGAWFDLATDLAEYPNRQEGQSCEDENVRQRSIYQM